MPVSSGTNARIIVYNTVVNWLAVRVNLPPAQIKVDRKFAGPPPGGYGQTRGSFMTMCDDISDTLSSTTGRSLRLTGAWRLKHQNDVIADFINAVAVVLMAAGTTPSGRSAVAWAMEN
jgi:hypothetical protein